MNPKIKDSLRNFQYALQSLEEALADPVVKQRDVAGVIQNFEFNFELSWKLLQRYLKHEGQNPKTPRETFSMAYGAQIIQNEKAWLKMIEDRNLSVHTYNKKLAREMLGRIQKEYLKEFQNLMALIQSKISGT
jgi:nucleotidyltransferase substrate binding protein (TIGR01987 family)